MNNEDRRLKPLPGDTETTKQCRKCGEVKLRTEYHLNRPSRDGLCCFCKTCRNLQAAAYQRVYNADPVHKERQRNVKRSRYATDAIFRQSRLDYAADWRHRNPEYQRRYWLRRKEKNGDAE